MSFDSKKIEEIYSGKLVDKYDFSIAPFFASWKKKAFEESSLKKGDRVIVFCCGTGLDFPHILQKVGKEGNIIGVDFSAEMLAKAKLKVEKNKWENIELIEADATKFRDQPDQEADVGVCTLGMSIIPEYKAAFLNLLSNVKDSGEIIIGDMQLASGWLARLNPFTLALSKKYGGTRTGHQNSLEIQTMMRKELTNVRKKEFFFKSYYYCVGNKKLRTSIKF